jgi:hypothetical protein
MRRVNSYHFYHLGARIHSIGDVYPGEGRTTYAERVRGALDFLANVAGAIDSPIVPIQGDAEALLTQARTICNGVGRRAHITDVEANGVKAALRDFEKAFHRSLEQSNAFEVEKVGIYDMGALISNADELFLPDTRQKLAAKTREDWCSAGKCLAFELSTAAGFHTVRATETVIHEYYIKATSNPITRKDRNWGAYVRNLNKHLKDNPTTSKVDRKLVSLIDQIREHHRNVVIHPEQTLTPSQAYTMFNVCQGAVISLVEGIDALL